MKRVKYLLIVVVFFNMMLLRAQQTYSLWNKPNLTGHWKLVNTDLVDEVPFLKHQKSFAESVNKVSEDSPWDHYKADDLIVEQDSLFKVDYPIQAFERTHFVLDSGYLHVWRNDYLIACPIQFANDTFICYTPVVTEPGYFKETFVRTTFNDSIVEMMRTYDVNYPELAGKWRLVREKDYDYGTHYELQFPHTIPSAIKLTRKQLTAALGNKKVYNMRTDGQMREYTFLYDDGYIYFVPGAWFKGDDDPMIHFEKE